MVCDLVLTIILERRWNMKATGTPSRAEEVRQR
jgi:hypothetical protein